MLILRNKISSGGSSSGSSSSSSIKKAFSLGGRLDDSL